MADYVKKNIFMLETQLFTEFYSYPCFRTFLLRKFLIVKK